VNLSLPAIYRRAKSLRFRAQNSREYIYEGFQILVPSKHSIVQILASEPYRNHVLRHAAAVFLSTTHNHFVDVGANIGDTALTITKASHVPLQLTLIEPSGFFRKYLEINSKYFEDYEIIPKFVSPNFPIVNLPGELLHWGGTAQVIDSKSVSIPVNQQISLHDVVKENTGLLKIDCDGQDTTILRNFLRNTQFFPTIYFENTIVDYPSLINSQETVELAFTLGYQFAIIARNDGLLIWAGQLGAEHLYDVFWMQLNVRKMNRTDLLYYTDVLLIHSKDTNKYKKLITQIRKDQNYNFEK
jgi:FkbM family methyltransferase